MRALDVICSSAFCVAIGAVPVLLATGVGVQRDAEFSELERRPRRSLAGPAWGRAALAAHFGSIEGWLSDHMPLRDPIIRARAAWLGTLGMPLNPGAVVVGRDGWLFFGDGVGRGIEQYRGLATLDDDRLEDLVSYLRSLRDVAAAAGIPCVIAIAPDKHATYPEFLPQYLARRGHGPADQLMAASPDLDLLDLRPALLEAKRSSGLDLYYRNDSHWNEFGAYLAYRAMMAGIPGVEPVAAAEADFRLSPPHRGDVAQLAGPAFAVDAENTYLRRDFFAGRLEVDDLVSAKSTSIPATEMTPVSHYRHFEVKGSGREGAALLIGDSFLDNTTRYFNNSFGRVAYQHYADFGGRTVAELVRQVRPRALVFEIVQRNLLLPTSRFIPAGGAPAGSSVLANGALLSDGREFRELRDARLDAGDAVLESTGFDPSFVLPQMPPMPSGATVIVELTLPGDRLVQLYYQTPDAPSFAEERSMQSALPAGRQRIEWRIGAALSGTFRLDPGNAPGEYRIHRVEFRP
jgi:hypothetical protein